MCLTLASDVVDNNLKGALKRTFGDKIHISKNEENHESINIKQNAPAMIFE